MTGDVTGGGGAAPPAPLVDALRTAAADLGLDVVAPYELEGGRQYAALIRGFGGKQGTLVDWLGSGHPSTGCGDDLFVSVLNPDAYVPYDRDLMVETLNDWGWQSDPARAPAWFTDDARAE